MDDDSQRPRSSTEKSTEMRERRRKAGVVQVNFFIRAEDKTAVVKAVRDYTDLAWLALYDAGAVLHGANEARAEDIRKRLQVNPPAQPDPSSNKG